MYVLLGGFFVFLLLENVRREKLSQNRKRHRTFARKRYTVTKRYNIGIPILGFVPSIHVADFRSMYRKLAKNPTFVWLFSMKTCLELC